MKKIMTICLIWAMLLILCGCQTSDNSTTVEPPRMLFFDSEDEYRALMAATAMSDEELEEYLSAYRKYGNFNMNGIRTRDDLERFIAFMDKMTTHFIRVKSGIDISSGNLTVYPDKNTVEIQYHINKIVYRYQYSLVDTDILQPDSPSLLEKNVVTVAIGGQELTMTISEQTRQDENKNSYTVPTCYGEYVEDGILVSCQIIGRCGDDTIPYDIVSTLFVTDSTKS